MTLPTYPLRSSLSLAGALLLLALPLGCKPAEPPADKLPPPAPVKWENAHRFNLSEWTELAGTTQPLPDRVARITAPVEGRVFTVLQGANGKPITEGQLVRKGDPVAELDATIIRANRDKAEAQLKVFKEDVTFALSDVKLATIEVKALKDLGHLAQSVAVQKADVTLEAAQSRLRSAERKQEAGQKEVDSLNEQLRLYTLTAPINGRLGRIQVVSGATLSVGTLVSDVLDVSEQIDVLCFVSGHIARQLQLGQKAQLGGLDRDSSAGPEGEIAFIAEQAEPDSGNFAVKVRFPNKEAQLRVNAVQQIRIQTRPEKESFAIPESALMEDQDPPTVVVVEEKQDDKGQPVKDDKGEPIFVARRVPVKIGIRDRVLHQVEVLGFEDPKWQGDVETALFVTEKGQGLQTGDLVKLQVEED